MTPHAEQIVQVYPAPGKRKQRPATATRYHWQDLRMDACGSKEVACQE